MADQWYYTQNGQQLGPISGDQLQLLVSTGQVNAREMVWCEGMANWSPAAEIPGLLPAAMTQPIAQAGSVAPAGSTIEYYNPTAGLGGRVAATLRGFPAPTGPQNEWPLSPTHLAQLQLAEKHRKSIRALASLFSALGALSAIGAVVVFIAFVFGAAASRGGGGPEIGIILIVCLVIGALTALYFLAASATRKCKTWPAITFIVLFSIGILLNLVSCMMSMSNTRGPGPGPEVIGAIFGSILPILFLVTCVKGLQAIPRFLACPVWCQEALVNAKL